MSSKLSNEDSGLPSYYDAVTANEPLQEQQPSNGQHLLHAISQTSIHSALLDLATRFNNAQTQKNQQIHLADQRALSYLIPHIKAFLTEYSTTTLPLATLILVPGGSIARGAVPADDDLRSADDFGRVVSVVLSPPATSEKKKKNALDFDDGEADTEAPVWDGEEMALRLAGYLSPKSDDAELPPRPGQSAWSPPMETATATTAPPSKKSSFFSWKRPASTIPAASAAVSPPSNVVSEAAGVGDSKTGDQLPKVAMVVKAEEVVFRGESELGLYENQTVWSIVVRVRVKGGKKEQRVYY